jgi:hypothetical protein
MDTPSKATSKLEHYAKDMIANTGNYIKSEMEICSADYKTLERMNRSVAERYANYTDLAKSISSEMTELNECYDHLFPLLVNINDIEKAVSELETAIVQLDVYSRRLETKFKQYMDKR